MAEHGTLLTFPSARSARAADPDALRSEAPLEVRVSPPEFAPISGLQSLRLGAELALRSRWQFMLAMVLSSLLALPGLLGAQAWAQQSAQGVIGLLVCSFGVIRGIDGRSRDRKFWAGLGAAPASFELGVVLVDLLFMTVVTGVAWVLSPGDPIFLLLGGGAAAAGYGMGSATRSAARSEAGRAGLLIAMLIVAAGCALVAFVASYGNFITGVMMQFGFMAAAGLGARVLLSGLSPESSAGRGRKQWTWLMCAGAGMLAVPLQFVQGVPESTTTLHKEEVLLFPDRDPFAGKQLWRTTEGGGVERLGVRGMIGVAGWGPHRSMMIHRTSLPRMVGILLKTDDDGQAQRMMVGGLASRLGLITANGQHIECDEALLVGDTRFDADGMGAVHVLSTGEVWRLDGDGCREISLEEAP